jgi:exodeoxyribonuclease V gamma subunit
LPGTEIELLDALSTHHDLHLWLPHPSDALWRSLAGVHGQIARRDDTSHREVGHPLLATLGRDLRELQRSLPTDRQTDEYRSGSAGARDRPDTLLGWLQSDITANEVRRVGRTLRSDDRSVQVHSCHGPARQIDVLREVLLGLLADDDTLEPRDILVMCPDIETYAPLIVAGFGLGDMIDGVHPAHKLRVRLADRSPVQTNPLLGVASQLLALAGGRATSSEVLNLAQAAPVRARFGFTDDNLEDIARWVRQANIRWGFDRDHRKPFGVDFIQNTWRFGIDRVLAGVAMSDDSRAWIDTTLPLDDVSSNRIELAGQLAEYVYRLHRVVVSLTGAKPLREWLTALADGIGLLARVDDDAAWQTSQLQREFGEVLADAGPRAQTLMRLPDIRVLLDRHLAGRPTRANFRTGTLTVCTMVPMRSVPHRVVCLVGLDDGVFPRLGVVDGDDVLARDPMTGERDIRSEDRQLLLDAIGAAAEKLVITYTGADEFSGQQRPPAVPLAELLDALDLSTEQRVRDTIVVTHPLQPFDTRNVIPGKLIPDKPFTFDSTVLNAARARSGDRAEKPPFLSGPLPAPPPDDVVLADLAAFFRDPVKGFYRALVYTLPWEVDGVQDAMPVDIDALEEWTVGDRMLDDMLHDMDPAQARDAEWRRGTLPPGRLGWRRATEIRDQAALLAEAARKYRKAEAGAVDVDIDLDLGGRRLTGTVWPVFGDRLVSVTYSKLDGRHLLQSWISLLALLAHDPGRDWMAICLGRPRRGTTPQQDTLSRPADAAVELLADLVAMYDEGRRHPLPLPPKTAFAWAQARHSHGDPERAALWKWKSDRYPGEDRDPAQERTWGKGAWLTVLIDKGLDEYARRLWLPMLRALD